MSLTTLTVRGVLWSGMSQWGKQLLNLLTTVVLARLLPPEDFGLLAMSAVFTGLFASVGDLGLGSALVQKEHPLPEEFNAAFWVSAGFGAASFVFMLAIAPLVASFFGVPALQKVLGVLGMGLVGSSLPVVQQSQLIRQLDFRRIAFAEVISSLCGAVLGIGAALRGMGVYSLVIQSLGTIFCSTIIYWLIVPWRPTFHFRGFDGGGLIRFGSNLTGFNAVNYVARNVDYLLIGKFLGADQLGYYSLAYRLMLFPLQNISAVLGRVVFPAFSAVQHDDRKLRDAFLRLSRYVAFITFPLMCGAFVVAPEFVRVVFGPSWGMAAPLIRILAIVGMLQSLGTNTGAIYLAKGRTDMMLRWGVFATGVIAACIAWGVQWGVREVALGYACANLVLIYPMIAIPFSLVGGRFSDVVRSVVPILTISLSMTLTAIVVRVAQGFVFQLPDAALLVYTAVVMLAISLLLIHRFMSGTVEEVKGLLESAAAVKS